MNASYEYILAGLIMLIMLATIQANVHLLISSRLDQIEQEDYAIAESILDMILLSPGSPPNWSESIDDPIAIGLASYGATEVYNLDSEKVIRLDENCSSYISPGKFRNLIGLSSDWGFILRLTPFLIIDIANESGGDFSITITDYKGSPKANVDVSAYYVHPSLGSGAERFTSYNMTGKDGKCKVSFAQKPGYILVVNADLLEVKVMQTYPEDLALRVAGDQVIQADVPLVSTVNYASGLFYGLSTNRATRFVKIDGFTYYCEFELWR